MDLTEEVKDRIDNMSYYSLLSKWRFGPIGDPMFTGETGKYYSEIMKRKREEIGNAEHVRVSKSLGRK